jgi:hypothetical protein
LLLIYLRSWYNGLLTLSVKSKLAQFGNKLFDVNKQDHNVSVLFLTALLSFAAAYVGYFFHSLSPSPVIAFLFPYCISTLSTYSLFKFIDWSHHYFPLANTMNAGDNFEKTPLRIMIAIFGDFLYGFMDTHWFFSIVSLVILGSISCFGSFYYMWVVKGFNGNISGFTSLAIGFFYVFFVYGFSIWGNKTMDKYDRDVISGARNTALPENRPDINFGDWAMRQQLERAQERATMSTPYTYTMGVDYATTMGYSRPLIPTTSQETNDSFYIIPQSTSLIENAKLLKENEELKKQLENFKKDKVYMEEQKIVASKKFSNPINSVEIS